MWLEKPLNIKLKAKKYSISVDLHASYKEYQIIHSKIDKIIFMLLLYNLQSDLIGIIF